MAADPSPLATASDTASYATAQASSVPSECSSDHQPVNNEASRQQQLHQQQYQQQQHVHTSSLHSISSIRTAHFTTRSEQFERLQRSTTPEGSMEVSPSKTPLRDRMNRLSIASTASGMVNFDDEDREEAERRWLDEEEAETAASSNNAGDTLAQVREEEEEDDEQPLSSSEDEMGSEEEEGDYRQQPHMTPSRSSTSVKSILKKSIASAEGVQASNVSIYATAIPHRTVTWSPSTLPPAKSPPTTEMSPEHPRGPLAAAEAYLLNLGQRQQDEYYQGFDSPYRQGPNREDDSFISSENSAMEIEEALLSRSSTSISPHNLSASSEAIEQGKQEESTDSLKLQGSSSKRGTAFMDRLKGLIPSPESSFADTQYAQKEQQSTTPSSSNQDNRILDPSMSNILDTTAPMHCISQDVTVNDSNVNTTLRQTNGPKPFLLRQSVILEESSILEDSTEYRTTQKKSSTSPTTSPDRSNSTTMLGGQSFVTAMQQPSPAVAVHTPNKQSPSNGRKEATSTNERSQLISVQVDQNPEIFETPAEVTDHAREQSAHIEQLEEVNEEGDTDGPDGSPSPSLRALPSMTPSSSSSSLIKFKPESPFTSLVNHLLSTQDELLSHRADQKTMLISLVSNLRGELASRDRQLDILESRNKSLERNLKQEKEERQKDKLQTKDRISTAFKEVDDIKNKLVVEIKRRDDAFKEELLHEKTKREMIEKQLESLRRNNGSSEEIEFLRIQLQDTRESLDEAKISSERASHDLERVNDLLEESKKEKHTMEMRLEASQRAQEDAQVQIDALSDDCDKLRKQTHAAEKQLDKASTDFERQMTVLRTKLNQSETVNAKIRRELEDVTHALHNERLEQTRQYDMSASVQESLRIDNERLASSVAKMERSKENSFHQLQVIKKDTAAVLAQKEERLAQLEAEILQRSLDRRAQSSQAISSNAYCTTCKESGDRNNFLESEVVRLREVVGKMRMESADREVKIARLNKTREQLKEDIEGLNIALEAKQMELAMLKRESHRLSGGNHENVTTIGGAGGISMVGMTTSTTRPHSRILKGRPPSVHDSTQGMETTTMNAGSTTFTAEQRRRSLKARTSAVNPGKRISIAHRRSIDTTPGVLSTINANSVNGNILSSTLTSRRTSSKLLDANESRQDKALEAASLVKTMKTVPSSEGNAYADKENDAVTDKTHQRIADLPSAPSHIIAAQTKQNDVRKRSNSSLIPA